MGVCVLIPPCPWGFRLPCPGSSGIIPLPLSAAMDGDARIVAAEVDGLRFSDWYESRGISRSTAFELLKALGMDREGHLPLQARPVPGSRRPVLFADANQLQALDAHAAALRDGRTTMAELRRTVGAIMAPQPSGTVPDDPQPAEAAHLPLLERLQAVALALDTGAPLTTAEVRQLLGVWPGSAEVRRGRIVARRHGRNAWTLDVPGSSGTDPT